MSVCPSAGNNSAPTGPIYMKPHYLNIFRNSAEKIQVSLKYDKNNEYFTWTPHLWQYRAHFVLESEMLHTKLEEQIKTHIL
jgi:hypothetical protein